MGNDRGRGTIFVLLSLMLVLALSALACAGSEPLTREQVLAQNDAISTLNTRLAAANDQGIDVLAPRGIAESQQVLEAAITKARDGDDASAQQLAKKGLERLAKAVNDSRRSSGALREVLESRERAMDAGAPALLTGRWADLETRLRDAARLAEGGNVEAAKDATPQLLDSYATLELDALKTDASGLARDAIQAARDAEADEYAPDTFIRAKKELDIAIGVLETDRSRVEQANVHARRAAEFAAQSQYIAELVKEFERRDYDREAVILWYQKQLAELTRPLEGGIAFTRPNHEVIGDARRRIEGLIASREDAQSQLAAAQARIERLELTASATAIDLEAMLAKQRENEARYDRVQSLFGSDEAMVMRRGRNVVLETYGFSFPVGQSEIQSSNFPLLKKISKAIGEFDNPTIIVTGHTDSTGGTEVNEKLSADRARKVGEFLVEIGGLDSDHVRSQGLGESRPLATNETEEGRARNRRIEILIVNQEDTLPAVASPPPPGS